jgi:hypothetical protein
LNLAEQHLIEPSVCDGLFELLRAFDIADLPEGIFDRPSGDELGSFAENVFEDLTRPPAGATSSTSLANTGNDVIRPEHMSQKRASSTNEFSANGLSEPEPAADAPPADDASVLHADATKRRRMHLVILAHSAGCASRAGSQNTAFSGPDHSKNQKGLSDAETAHYLLTTYRVSNMTTQFILLSKVCACNASI